MGQWWVVVEVSDRAGLVTTELSAAGTAWLRGRKAAWLQKLPLAGAGPQKHGHPGTLLPVGMVLGLCLPRRDPISSHCPQVHHSCPISHCCFPLFSEVASSSQGSGSFSLIIPAFTDPQAVREAALIQIHPHAVLPSEGAHCPPTAQKHWADEGLLPAAFIRENPSPCALPGRQEQCCTGSLFKCFLGSQLSSRDALGQACSLHSSSCLQSGWGLCVWGGVQQDRGIEAVWANAGGGRSAGLEGEPEDQVPPETSLPWCWLLSLTCAQHLSCLSLTSSPDHLPLFFCPFCQKTFRDWLMSALCGSASHCPVEQESLSFTTGACLCPGETASTAPCSQRLDGLVFLKLCSPDGFPRHLVLAPPSRRSWHRALCSPLAPQVCALSRMRLLSPARLLASLYNKRHLHLPRRSCPMGKVRQSWADRIRALGPCWRPVQPTKAFRTLQKLMISVAQGSPCDKPAVFSTEQWAGLWGDLTLRLCWWQMRTPFWDAPGPCTPGRS